MLSVLHCGGRGGGKEGKVKGGKEAPLAPCPLPAGVASGEEDDEGEHGARQFGGGHEHDAHRVTHDAEHEQSLGRLLLPPELGERRRDVDRSHPRDGSLRR